MHLALPLWFAAITVFSAFTTKPADRALLLSLPALAALAAFALPTLRHSLSALIDWFTLLFFTGCGVVIWVIWFAMQTGVPRQAAVNVFKQAPNFHAEFSLPIFLIALLASLVWAWQRGQLTPSSNHGDPVAPSSSGWRQARHFCR